MRYRTITILSFESEGTDKRLYFTKFRSKCLKFEETFEDFVHRVRPVFEKPELIPLESVFSIEIKIEANSKEEAIEKVNNKIREEFVEKLPQQKEVKIEIIETTAFFEDKIEEKRKQLELSKKNTKNQYI